MWERGDFKIPSADSIINESTVLVLAGSYEQLSRYDQLIGTPQTSDAPMLIIGGGRVGKAIADALQARGMDYRVIESNLALIASKEKYMHGSAADLDTLVSAGISKAPTIFITNHNDDINIYLTIYCRKLRADTQIISRADLDRNINKLHKAGADIFN